MKLLNFTALMTVTVFTVPFYNVLMSILMCYKDSPVSKDFKCYEGTYYIHFSFACLGMVIMVLFSLIFSLLYIDQNPCSQHPFAGPQSRLSIFRLFLKISIPLYFLIDYQKNNSLLFIYIITAIYFLMLIIRVKATEMYNK
jgi:hypothetical protein